MPWHGITSYPISAAFDWSKTDESIVALGLGNGSANLVKLRSHDAGGSDTAATFKIKQQRKCNSVAFSTQDWLAVAVDKTRSDVCLFIYDTNRGEASTEPIRRLCAAELVSSVRFFAGRPQEIIAGTQRAFIRLYDLREMAMLEAVEVFRQLRVMLTTLQSIPLMRITLHLAAPRTIHQFRFGTSDG